MSLAPNVALPGEDMRSVQQLYPWQVQAEHQRWRSVQTVHPVNLAPSSAAERASASGPCAQRQKVCAVHAMGVSYDECSERQTLSG